MSLSDNTLTFFWVFLLGLGLNLTPCVYPMLSITLSLFRSQHETSRRHAFLKSLIYVLGMAVIYSTLGVVTAFTGGLFGAALQSRWVLLAISILMAGMAASLFGLYVIQAPQWLIRAASKRGSDLIGTFFSGMFVGVFAAPCIGPLMIALIAFVAQKGDPVFAFRTFFVMSLGLGFPYLILGTFAGLANRLPKSGVWLVWIDRFFGTVLLAVAGFYFILALNPSGLPWLLPISLAAGGLYLGFIEKSKGYTPKFLWFKRIAGTVAILSALAFMPFVSKTGVVWEKYEDSKLAQAAAHHQPVIIDFYADWCIPCHELDQQTYSHPKVVSLLEPFARFKVDLTHPEGEATQKLIEKYEVIGVPTVIFLDSKGREVKEARLAGFVPPEEFVEITKKIQ